jgi:serine/threonine protein kinase
MKHVILAEPSTLALLGLGVFLLIFLVVAVLGAVVIWVVFLTRKAKKEEPPVSQPTASTQVIPKNCPKCGASMPPDSPEGLCPRCLIALNLATQTEIPGEPGAVKALPGPPTPVADVAKLFPQLEILECLGRGGMGAVYKARQPRLDRVVALKILSPEKQGNQKFADRFEREARALAKLHHPNIVTVYDFGEVDGNFYLLMEFVDGLSLRQLLQSRKLSPPEALAIVPKICEALQYAHEQGIVHRDIKPENILMDKDGRVKIADFGIAKILGDGGGSNLTAEQVIGTPHYMSPEQIEKPQTVDHRADIYSLGVVFYEMLTGELPLGKFQPPSKKVQVDVRLDEIVLRALEKEPERRYQQASEVKTRVETIANSPNGSGQRPFPSFNDALSRFVVPGVAVLIIIALVFFLNFRSSHPSSPVSVPLADTLNTTWVNHAALLAVESRGLNGVTRWSPDGTTLSPALESILAGYDFPGTNGNAPDYVFTILLRNPPDSSLWKYWDGGGAGSFNPTEYPWSSYARVETNSELGGVIFRLATTFAEEKEDTTVTFGVPSGPPRNLLTWDNHPYQIHVQESWSKSEPTPNLLVAPYAPPDGSAPNTNSPWRSTVTLHLPKYFDPEWHLYLTAVDENHREHRSSYSVFLGSRETQIWMLNLPPTNIISIKLQAYQNSDFIWSEFNNVRLKPDGEKEGQTKEAAPIIDEQPPVVVETFPVSGTRDVAPGDMEIRVRFSKDMMDGDWSWSTAWENSTPESLGPPHYLDDHRTCVMKVHLEPGKTYAWWLNSNKFHNFKDAAGEPSVPYLFSFQTKSH